MNTEAPARLNEILATLNDAIKSVVKKSPARANAIMSVHGPLVVFVIRTDPDDARWIFGRQGKHFKALRTLLAQMVARDGMEVDLIFDEKVTAVPPPRPNSAEPFSQPAPKKISKLHELITRMVSMCVDNRDALSIKSTDLNSTVIFEIKVAPADYQNVYGRPITTEDGFPTGATIEAFKNIFDALGKNFGRLIRIVLTK
jgi:predicted RNA-binding protein YlqC (UPF0109 family)